MRMRMLVAVVVVSVFVTGVIVGGRWQTPALAQELSVVMNCGVSSKAQVRTTLYFGLSRQKGPAVNELEWQLFLRDEVTKRFPNGLTVWEATGQWRTPTGRIDREQSKVLLLVHADTPAARQSVQSVIDSYRKAFDQESVLWESARVCVAG